MAYERRGTQVAPLSGTYQPHAQLRRDVSPLLNARPAVLTSNPPTVVQTNDITITGAYTLLTSKAANATSFKTSIAPTDTASLRYLGTGQAPVLGVGGNNVFGVQWTYRWDATSLSGILPMRVEFMFDGSTFEFVLKKQGGTGYRIKVDGQYVTAYPQTMAGTTGSNQLFTVTFGSRQVRRIELEIIGFFYGINCQVNDTVWAPANPAKRILWLGDSYTGGANAVLGLSTYVQGASQLLGYDDWINSGVGGTGYLNDAAGVKVKFRDRLTNDVTNLAPSIVVVAGGHNDTTEQNAAYTTSAVQTEAALLFAAIKAALPSAQLWVLGPLYQGAKIALYPAYQTAIFAAAAGVADLTVDTITRSFFTGTGNAAAPSGTGNSDLYIDTDTVHPTQVGHDFLAYNVAQGIKNSLLAAA